MGPDPAGLPNPAIASCAGWPGQAAGMPLLQQIQSLWIGGNRACEQLEFEGGAALEHFPQMPQQPEAGDVRAGWMLARWGFS